MQKIDLNCDMGESWHDRIIGQDEALMPHLTSCNLACGVHGGDPETTANAIRLAARYGVKIGAHPSLPDRSNFGRQAIDLPLAKLESLLFTQLTYLQEASRSAGQSLHHLKPHGALYHLAAHNEKEASVVVEATLKFGIGIIYGPPNSLLQAEAKAAGLEFWREGFVDRAYENGHALRNRQLMGAVHQSAIVAAQQAHEMVAHQNITDFYGVRHAIEVDTLCIHGDHAGALETILAVKSILEIPGVN